MKINLNNVRKQAVFAYSRLVKNLNREIDKCGGINIDASVIQEDLDDLRNMLVAMACSYLPDTEDFKDLADEIGDVPVFNPEPGEEEEDEG